MKTLFSNYTFIATNKLLHKFVALMFFAFAFVLNVQAQCDTVLAYTGRDITGSQNYTERLGMIFTVNQSVKVYSLGAYDSDQDGLNAPITVGIIRLSDNATMAGPITISGTTDPLIGLHRVRGISPVILAPGQYVIVAVGYGPSEANGNSVVGDLNTITDANGGLLTFDSASFGGVGFGTPTNPWPTANVFHAGTFEYSENDTTPPTIVCPASITINSSEGADSITFDCRAQVDNIDLQGARDICGLGTISYSIDGPISDKGTNDASGSYFSTGSNTVTYTVSDLSGNTATCVFTVLIVDDEAPTITCPANVTINNQLDSCNAIYNYRLRYDDNCVGLNITGFADRFIPSRWTLSNDNGGNGSVQTSGAPDSIGITSSNLGGPGHPASLTKYCINIPGNYAGSVSFDWSYATLDVDPSADQFSFSINGTSTLLTTNAGPNNQSGSITTVVNPNDEFCFEMNSVDQAKGAATAFISNFKYIEGINPVLTQTAGLPSGSSFPVGVTTNTFEVTDNNRNTATCSFTVTVVDVQRPTIECPDDVVIDLDPLECEGEALFDAVADDNCPGVTYEVTSPLESGDLFPIGVSTVIYTATDAAGNTATCSFEVNVNDYFNSSLGCINSNVSLDENCESIVGPTFLLTGFLSPTGDTLLGCLDSFKVNFIAPNGTNLGNVLTGDYLGKTLNYTIINELHGFNCWGTVKVEDKFPPRVVCTNDTISCVTPLSAALKPEVLDNCSGAKLVLLSEVPTQLSCDSLFLSKITKTWTVVDAYGNKGDTCTQEIYIKRTNTSKIQWPRNEVISCTSFTTQYPPVSLTGVPRLDGFALYPLSQAVICNGFSTFTDVDVISAECKRIIQRTWEVGEWWCNSTNIKTWVQIIEVKDDVAPVIAPLADITVSTGSGSCKATFTLPKASITDNCNTFTVKISTGEAVLNTNGGITQLSVGAHSVTYTATDKCGNQSTASIRVVVSDLIEPIAVCRTKTVVSLKDDGTAWLHKSSVDNGSFDECGPVELKIRRMTSTCDTTSTKWVDEVAFCCADVGKEIMVGLLVTDGGENSNQCMIIVEVQDKRIATMTCPANLTVDCTTAYDPNNLSPAFGATTISGGGCASNANVTEVLTGALNSCLIGELTRTFTLKQNGLVTGTCTQTITFRPTVPFNESMIVYPRDTTFVNTRCTPLDLDPSTLPAKYGKPQLINEGVCDLVGSSYTDDVYSFNGNGACYKIVRHWTVINWCYKVAGKIWQDSFDQVLVVMNNIAPRITSTTVKREMCSYNADCTPVAIKLEASATDDCTPVSELKWRWTITFKNGIKQRGTGRDASGTYAFGLHHIDFEVEDKCGNIAYTGYDFEVKSCKAPTAYCKQGLSTELVAMDTDGNGTPDAEMSVLKPRFFDNGSSHTCGNAIKLSFSADVNDTILTVSCPQKNKNVPVQLWVTDINGNTSFCATFVNVQDNNNVNICPATSPTDAGISGKVITNDGRGVKSVTVTLASVEERLALTDADGNYKFDQLELDASYKVTPKKSDDVLNGVSTLDLVLIQRHILGAAKLTDPYKIMAADINKDGKITASDLVALRKLILGSESKMIDDESWRFVTEGQTFADPNNPMTSQLIHDYDVAKLEGDMVLNFVGLKVGDVNGSVVANAHDNTAENRSNRELNLYYEDKYLKAGESMKIKLMSQDITKIQGMQTTIAVKGLKIKNIEGEDINSANIFNIENGLYTMSFNTKGGKTYAKDGMVMIVEVEATESGILSNMWSMTSDKLQSEAYLGEEAEIATIAIRAINVEDQVRFDVGQNIPNPWQNTTVVPVTMPERGELTYSIKDNNGRTIMTRSQVLDKGVQKIEIKDGKQQFTTGVYFFEATFNDGIKIIKMIKVD